MTGRHAARSDRRLAPADLERLLVDARAGRSWAWQYLFARFYPTLHRLFASRVRPARAEAYALAVLLDAYEELGREPAPPAPPDLDVHIFSLVRAWLPRRGRPSRRAPDVPRFVARRRVTPATFARLSRLPGPEREALELLYVVGLRAADAAAVLGVPQSRLAEIVARGMKGYASTAEALPSRRPVRASTGDAPADLA